jgi:hypothetical protein
MKNLRLNPEQEDAANALYESVGASNAAAMILGLLEKDLGKVHHITCKVRIMLNSGEFFDQREKANKLVDESKLTDVLFKRIDIAEEGGLIESFKDLKK